MKWLQTAFTKIKDYFTANLGRKIFFCSLVAGIFFLICYTFTHNPLFQMIGVWALILVAVGTLVDSMYSRYNFLQKVRNMQYEHLKEIYDKQAAGEAVEMTPTFSYEEDRYIRRRKRWFIFAIILKTGIVLGLFSLLLAM